jgi:hypothetical protein
VTAARVLGELLAGESEIAAMTAVPPLAVNDRTIE